MKKQQFDQPFCLTAVSFIFTFLSLAADISILVLQITNNQLSLFSQSNTNYQAGLIDISPTCTTYAAYSTSKYYCSKYSYHIYFLQITNALLIGAIFVLLLIGTFLTVLIVNIKRKSHKCMSQKSTKQTILGLLSLEMVMAFSLLGYYISFYIQFDTLTLLSTNVSDYRSTFFIGLVVSCAGGVFALVNYIITFIIKVQIEVKTDYLPANQRENTLNTTVGNEKTERQGNTNMPRKQNLPSKVKDRQRFYNNREEENQKVERNKEQVNLEEVAIDSEEPGTDFKSHQKRITNGITRERPKLPTKSQVRTHSYPRLQRPFFYTGKKNKKNADDLKALKEAKDDSINKPLQNGDMEVYQSILPEQAEEGDQNKGKQNQMIDANKQGSDTKQRQIEMINLRQNTNFGSQGEVSNMDPTRLFVFERTLAFTEHLKVQERKSRYKPA